MLSKIRKKGRIKILEIDELFDVYINILKIDFYRIIEVGWWVSSIFLGVFGERIR